MPRGRNKNGATGITGKGGDTLVPRLISGELRVREAEDLVAASA
jgi:hypothetical protein